MINPFAKFQQRSQTLPSADSSPYLIQNGKGVPVHMVNARNALHNSDIFSVVNRISSDIASCAFIAPDPFTKVLRTPNNLINGYNFWQSVLCQLLLAGNSYVTITRDENNVPTRLELVATERVEVILSDNAAGLVYRVTYNDERPQQEFDSQHMLHFRLLPSGQAEDHYLIGMSPLESLQTDVQMQELSNRLTISTLKNAIRPSTVLTVPQGVLDKDARQHIRDEFEEANTGDNQGHAMVLDQGLNMDTVSIDSDVASFLNNYTFSKEQIAKAFTIPSTYLEGNSDEQSSIEMIRELYISDLASAYFAPISSELTAKFGVPITQDIAAFLDPSHQKIIDNVAKLATGSTPVLNAADALAILKEKGAL
ncbi:phage portal protein [Lacticaseibacillus pantheris]|uniref:phage portal protein n=1 Tax=Lacticaseibacillus pantheris TaxID=171523 RepID=UPI00265B1953|nr:phage portal protein [Lacticaseibacillus pantheris]WKF86018.1 phage portal protein [Lacticaseibacillus pantheris]